MMRRWPLNQAARVLRGGGIIAYPTESVFGLGCDPFNPVAVHQLLAIKQRPIHKGLILVAASQEQFSGLIQAPTSQQAKMMASHWPGPTTLVMPASDNAPNWLTGGFSSLALRVSDHPQVRALCERFAGPIVSTSANFSGATPARNAAELQRRMGSAIDYILPGKVGGLANPTQIIDASTGAILREA